MLEKTPKVSEEEESQNKFAKDFEPSTVIPFLDAIQQVPSYAKFLQDLSLSRKGQTILRKLF